MTRRAIAMPVMIVTALLLQSTVFADLRLLGVRPELLFLVTIVFALLEGPDTGASIGFLSGLAQDFMIDAPKGITALTLTLLGYAVGTIRRFITSPSPLLPTTVVGVGTVAGVGFQEIVSFLLGAFHQSAAYGAKVALLSGLYNAVLTPILYPALRRAAEGSRPRRVVRF